MSVELNMMSFRHPPSAPMQRSFISHEFGAK
jgi:hypothetical protein